MPFVAYVMCIACAIGLQLMGRAWQSWTRSIQAIISGNDGNLYVMLVEWQAAWLSQYFEIDVCFPSRLQHERYC
jgi:hypothetical protein